MKIQEFLPPEEVPMEFREYVDKAILSEWMGEECEDRLWGKTPFGQYFVLVTSKVSLFPRISIFHILILF